MLIAEVGTSSSWGIAHYSSNGMNHGGSSEIEQGLEFLRLLDNIKEAGCAGGIQFSWIDEWFKRTWLTDPFDFNPEAATIFSLSAEWSQFRAGPEGSPWERQNQFVAGLNALVNRSSRLFIEYFNTAGYSPLNFISGGNMAPGETHSTRGASSNGIVIGAQINL